MSDSKINKILVIGGYGFIGSHLSAFYDSIGVEVHRTSRFFNLKSTSSCDYNSDYSKESFVKIKKNNFDLIFYLSGNPYPAFSEKDASYDINHTLVPTINLLNALVETSFSGTLWYASSVAVYGETKLAYQSETDICRPISSYGLTKLTAEEYIKLYARNFNISAGSLRLFSTFGEGLKRQIIYDLFLKCKNNSDEIELFGTGKEERDICYVEDQVKRISNIAKLIKPFGDVFNIGSGLSYSTDYIAKSVIEIMGSKKKIKYIESTRKFDGYKWTACTKKFKSVANDVEPNFKKSLKKTIYSYEMELEKK